MPVKLLKNIFLKRFRSASDLCGSNSSERKREEAGVVRAVVRPNYRLTKIATSPI